MKTKKKLELSQFIHWDWGENYPFSACMMKLMECLGGDTKLYTYGFFAGISGDDFVFAYGNNGQYNDCVSVCSDVHTFCKRVFGLIGLDYTILPWDSDRETLLKKLQEFIDRGIPVLSKGAEVNMTNFNLVCGYEDDIFTEWCGAMWDGEPQYSQPVKLGEDKRYYIFIDTLPKIDDLAAVYRESMLQLPALMRTETPDGVTFGSAGLNRFANDIENGRYDKLVAEEFDSWRDWSIYICNIATNAAHGWDFLARAYVHNPDMPSALRMIALLHRNERDVWNPLEGMGMGIDLNSANFADAEKKAEAVRLIRKLAQWHEEIENMF